MISWGKVCIVFVNFAGQILLCFMSLLGKFTRQFMRPSYFAPLFYGAMQTLTCQEKSNAYFSPKNPRGTVLGTKI